MRYGICPDCLSVAPVDEQDRMRGHRIPGRPKRDRCRWEGKPAAHVSEDRDNLQDIATNMRKQEAIRQAEAAVAQGQRLQ